MTFQEYLNQTHPERHPRVELTMKDLYNVWGITYRSGKAFFVQLLIHGEVFTYKLDDEREVLWTMDNDGNSKSRSCFVIKDFKEPTQRIFKDDSTGSN